MTALEVEKTVTEISNFFIIWIYPILMVLMHFAIFFASYMFNKEDKENKRQPKDKKENKNETLKFPSSALAFTLLTTTIVFMFFSADTPRLGKVFIYVVLPLILIDILWMAFIKLRKNDKSSYVTKDHSKNRKKTKTYAYVDLGLPSGTLWAKMNVKNEKGDDIYISIDQAIKKFGKKLPTLKKWKELFKYCTYKWNEERKGIDVIGPNGKSIFLPGKHDNGESGIYWTSSIISKGNAHYVSFSKNQLFIGKSFVFGSAYGLSVRLCKNKNTEKPKKVQANFNID